MIGFLVKVAVLLVVGVLAYNYFFGSVEEKAQSSKVFGQMKDVAVSVGDLAKSEKGKFDAGKYDAALEKLGAAYQAAREGARNLDASLLKRINELETRKAGLKKELDSIGDADASLPPPGKTEGRDTKAASAIEQQRRKESLQADLNQLVQDSEALLKKTR